MINSKKNNNKVLKNFVKLAKCSNKNCSHLRTLHQEELQKLEEKLKPITKKCLSEKKKKKKSFKSLDKCLSKSNDYLRIKDIMKNKKKELDKCLMQKCKKLFENQQKYTRGNKVSKKSRKSKTKQN